MDLLKNPFLLPGCMPASLLALNPQLMQAQLAQLQAAQMMLAKQQAQNGAGFRKRSVDEDEAAEVASRAKYPRSSSPIDGRTEPTGESPLDLSGNKSPELKKELGSFNPNMLPPHILSFFNQLKPPGSEGLFPARSPPSPPSPPSRPPWQHHWMGKAAEAAGGMEDIFRCVWCKESYHTLEALTSHMQEA